MKKLFILSALFIAGLTMSANAQVVKDHAIGLRFGGGNGFGTEVSYQHGLSDINRLEFDLGLISQSNYTAWGLTGVYQWVWPLGEGFNWYVGPGAKIGSWDYKSSYTGSGSSGLYLAAAGDIGIEYAWPFGLQLGLDMRPELGLLNHGDSFNFNLGLGVRYQF